ncbi:hypothetical protein DENIS_0930 [Desulfonema ishimotonii]|uniref:Uncharacterized protein n=1 Tax=Desulfonema ishimotonii TaxID=45657 RepID=A0A401FSQ0_9BACT|nr:hypothetical protein [Desulfonema ishimotonii]GBC59988.1 hypothetical protein DENIS_0930 [Desulfonema ishimotonii]
MERTAPADIGQHIADLLAKKGKSWLTVTQVRNSLNVSALRSHHLTKTSRPSEVLNAVRPHTGRRLMIYKGPRTHYIGLKMSPETMVLEKIKQHPGLSSRKIGKDLPLLKKAYIACLNRLIAEGAVRCTLNDAHGVGLNAVQGKEKETEKPPSQARPDYRSAFKTAYDETGRGRHFVRIHRLREYLNWPGDTFDTLLRELMADYIIELHGGDPSTLTAQQIADSFTDKDGTLYITLTWWGKENDGKSEKT